MTKVSLQLLVGLLLGYYSIRIGNVRYHEGPQGCYLSFYSPFHFPLKHAATSDFEVVVQPIIKNTHSNVTVNSVFSITHTVIAFLGIIQSLLVKVTTEYTYIFHILGMNLEYIQKSKLSGAAPFKKKIFLKETWLPK